MCVLDTKYKASSSPSSDDIAQVVTYSEAKNCSNAILVYPAELAIPLDETIGDNRVRNLTFSLDGDIERNGQMFLEELLGILIG